MNGTLNLHGAQRVEVRRNRHADGTNVLTIDIGDERGGYFTLHLFSDVRLGLVDDARADEVLDADREAEDYVEAPL